MKKNSAPPETRPGDFPGRPARGGKPRLRAASKGKHGRKITPDCEFIQCLTEIYLPGSEGYWQECPVLCRVVGICLEAVGAVGLVGWGVVPSLSQEGGQDEIDAEPGVEEMCEVADLAGVVVSEEPPLAGGFPEPGGPGVLLAIDLVQGAVLPPCGEGGSQDGCLGEDFP